MKCPNCGAENMAGTNFCVNCGTNLNAAPAENTAPVTPEVQAEPVAEYAAEPVAVPQEPVYEAPAAPEFVPVPEEPKAPKKSCKGLVKKLVGLGIFVLILVLIILGIKSCSSGDTIDFESLPLIYSTSSDDVKFMFATDEIGEDKKLVDADDSAGDIMMTLDGSLIFFGKNRDEKGEFDLYYRESSEEQKLDNSVVKGITDYMITPEGDTIFYIKNKSLYISDRDNDDPIKIGKNVSYVVDYAPTQDGVIYSNDEGDIIYACEDFSIKLTKNEVKGYNYDAIFGEEYITSFYASFTDDGRIFMQESTCKQGGYDEEKEEYVDSEYYNTFYSCEIDEGAKPEMLADNVNDVYPVSEDWSELYYIDDENILYYKNGETKSVILKNAEYIYATGEDFGSLEYYATVRKSEEGERSKYSLYYIDGEETIEMLKNVEEIDLLGRDFEIVKESEYDETDDEYEYTYYVRDGAVLTKFAFPDDECRVLEVYNDAVYVLEDVDDEKGCGTLVKYDLTSDGIDADDGEILSEDVVGIDILYEEYYAYNMDDLDAGYIEIEHYDGGEAFTIYDGSEVIEVSSDFSSILAYARDGVLYLKEDYNDRKGTFTLSRFDGGKPEIIAEDVKKAVVLAENLIYLINEDDELCINEGDRESTIVIDADNCELADPFYCLEYISNFYTEEELYEMCDHVLPN